MERAGGDRAGVEHEARQPEPRSLAIEVAPDAAATIDAGLAPLRRRHKAKWTSTDAFHLTLAFLGSVDPAAAPAIGDLARTVAARTAPFAMTITFDGPTGEACVVRRDVSNSALQALTLLNDPVFAEMAVACSIVMVCR